eukprot:501096_1
MSQSRRKRKSNEISLNSSNPKPLWKKRKLGIISTERTTNSCNHSTKNEIIKQQSTETYSKSMKCFNCNNMIQTSIKHKHTYDVSDETESVIEDGYIIRCIECNESIGCQKCCSNNGNYCNICEKFWCYNCYEITLKTCDSCLIMYCKECTNFKPKKGGGIECSDCQIWWKKNIPASAFCTVCGSQRSHAHFCKGCDRRICIGCPGYICDECEEFQCEDCNDMDSCIICGFSNCDTCGIYCECHDY